MHKVKNNDNIENKIRSISTNVSEIHSILTDSNFTLSDSHRVNLLSYEAWEAINNLYKELSSTQKKQKFRVNFLLKFPLKLLFSLIAATMYIQGFKVLLIIYLYLVARYFYPGLLDKAKDYFFEIDDDYVTRLGNIQHSLEIQEANYERRLLRLTSEEITKRLTEEEKDNLVAKTLNPANTLIMDYIDGYEVDFASVSPEIQNTAIAILKEDLQMDSNNLIELLEIAKRKLSSNNSLERKYKPKK